jgi:hypothetical protein
LGVLSRISKAIVAKTYYTLFSVLSMRKSYSILGLWQPGERFESALAQGSFKGVSYIKVMDWMAQKAAQTLAQTGRLTVVVQDNGSSIPVCWCVNSGHVGKSRDYAFSFAALLFRNESD